MLPTLPIPSGPRARRHLLPRPTPPTVVASSRRLPRAFSPARRGEAEGAVRAREEAGGPLPAVLCRGLGEGRRAGSFIAALCWVGKTAIAEGLAACCPFSSPPSRCSSQRRLRLGTSLTPAPRKCRLDQR
ncbi:hypothetical protein ZWY2020_015636 [Hordeum vulgare]|nr:hypothetical protein ZWY2020_015636 [Hordeum vulgare]